MTVIESDVAAIPGASASLDIFSRWMLAFSIAVVAAVAIVFLLLTLPANDDWVRAVEPRLYGWWPYFHKLYMTWQGRWAAFGLESAVLPRGDVTKTYPALIAAVAVVNLLGVYVFCRFFTRYASRVFSVACAAGLSAVLWAQMPSLAQAVYWFTGVVENTMSLSLGAMLLVGLVCIHRSIAWIVFASVFAILICGFHESYGAMLCVALAAGTVSAYWMRSANRQVWLIVLIAAVIGLGIVAGAPGNRVRMRNDGPKHVRHMGAILKLAASQFWNSGRAWLFDPKLLAASLWIAFSPRLEASRPVWTGVNRVPWRLLIPITWLTMLAIGFFAPSYAFGNAMPPRTLSGNFTVFATGWLVIVFLWTRRLDVRDTGPVNIMSLRSGGATAIARLVLALALILGGNTMDAFHDLATRGVLRWRSSVEHRYALLRLHGEDDRILPRLAPPSRLMYFGEISTDPELWLNYPMAEYFGLEKIRVLPAVGVAPTTAPAMEVDPAPPKMGAGM